MFEWKKGHGVPIIINYNNININIYLFIPLIHHVRLPHENYIFAPLGSYPRGQLPLCHPSSTPPTYVCPRNLAQSTVVTSKNSNKL